MIGENALRGLTPNRKKYVRWDPVLSLMGTRIECGIGNCNLVEQESVLSGIGNVIRLNGNPYLVE